MRALIRMTWATNRRLLLLMSPLLAFYLSLMVYTQITGNGVDLPAIAFTTMFLLLVVSTFQGPTFDVEAFLVSLPVTRSQLVRARYLTSGLGLLAGLALPLTVAGLAHTLLPGHAAAPTPQELRATVFLAIVDAVGLFVFLPLIHTFEPSRGILAFCIATVLALGGGLAWGGLDGVAALFHFFQDVLARPLPSLAVGGCLLALGLVSLGVSILGYARRSF